MKTHRTARTISNPFILLFVILCVVSSVVFVSIFRVGAQTEETKPKREINLSKSLPNFDIRVNSKNIADNELSHFREEARVTASDIAEVRDEFIRSEIALRESVPALKVEYNVDLQIPEVISPDISRSGSGRLTTGSELNRIEVLRDFGKRNRGLFGITEDQFERLEVANDYINPSGNMAFAQLDQQIDGIRVFRGEIKAGFTSDGKIIRIINNLAPGVDYQNVSKEFGDPLDAVRSAADNINYKLQTPDVTKNKEKSTEKKIVFGEGDWATIAEKIYFPTEIGVVRSAWLVLIWHPANSYYVAVDGSTGLILWRKSITEFQTQSAVFDVYSSSQAWIGSADSPAPLTPGPIDPATGTQGALINRTLLTAVGNEAPNPGQNNLGWITDDTNTTDGNNVEAGIDRDGINGVDAPQPGDGVCPGAGCRSFTSTWNPPPGNPPPGDAPLNPQSQRGAVVQYFYLLNRFHDVFYDLGFNEAAGNFQHDNFGRGGLGGDRLSAEAQDSSGTNGANASFAGDGIRGLIQMFIWTGAEPDRDGAADSQTVVHEATHGVSIRLHGNGIGLSSNMSRAMGEGWSDFYAQAMLSESSDPADGVYAMTSYISYLTLGSTYDANYYYGIRRFPLALISFTGGPLQRPHNPLTFGNLNAGNCSSFISAFPAGPASSPTCDSIHNGGTIWSAALWEVRGRMIARHGWQEGTRRTLQIVTDGMKISPLNPTFIQSRDAIIAAASTLSNSVTATDVADVREGFRRRGMGHSASVQNASPAVVTEAFDLPNVRRSDFDGDGRTDISTFRPSEGNWYILGSNSGFFAVNWGLAGDVLATGDYDGDGKADIAVFRASDVSGANDWWILNSNGFTLSGASWGSTGDIPVVSDYDGDGKDDIAVWRPSNAVVYALRSGGGVMFSGIGTSGDTPLAGDFDGDGTADPSTFNDGVWRSNLSAGGTPVIIFGTAGDLPAAGDFDGDGKTDRAVFRPLNGTWYIRNSSSGLQTSLQFGTSGDIPVPGDYDGDGKEDAAIYRNGQWWINGSTSGVNVFSFGLPNDIPVVRYANP